MAVMGRNGLLLLAAFVTISSAVGPQHVCPTKPDVNSTLQILYEDKMVPNDQVPEMSLIYPPNITWPDWSSTASNDYKLFMLDPDISCKRRMTDVCYLHGLVELNITSADNVVRTKTFDDGEYASPSPLPNDTHRYQFHLHRVKEKLNSFVLPTTSQQEVSVDNIKTIFRFPDTLTASFQYKYEQPKAALNKSPSEDKIKYAAQRGLLLWEFLSIVFIKCFIELLLYFKKTSRDTYTYTYINK
ncbi:uncharacterized protein LOC112563292 [Pomacea canaliculata]|uniref:uncharacterized protein LOC112563292 n=1 Tax=Pomacea canaliculata TaxID=400727 RepID=UPI000D736E6C|nr:uncharacterized protein LOC112563292 [Pomacea canaliculata]